MPENNIIYSVNADFAQPSESGLYGHLESIDCAGLSGWLVDLEGKSGIVTAYVNGKPAASGNMDVWRQDIADIVGLPKAYGFHLAWHGWELAEQDFSGNENYPLIFELAGKNFIFANAREIPGKELIKVVASLPKKLKTFTPGDFAEQFEQASGEAGPQARQNDDVKLIAYYLPQFHPVPENDSWWGAGFTEWANVSQARPLFRGHYQPQLPGELGFYDLRLAETRKAQADLARSYGIYGFCYYYYWFKGRKLLDRPLREVVESGEPDFPFCICWANESWSRRWNGSEQDLMIKQEHDAESDRAFIEDIMPILLDPRYIRVNGAPLLLIYNVSIMPDPKATAAAWQQYCKGYGIEKLYLCAADTFREVNPLEIGFDAGAQFPPHHTDPIHIEDEFADLPADFEGNIFEYKDVVRKEFGKKLTDWKLMPGVMTDWDNTARLGKRADIYYGATPALYETWLRFAIDKARANLPAGERFVFINAWNEWAEGAHLEPDRKYGRGWLEATRRALTRQSDFRELLAYGKDAPALEGETKNNLLQDLEVQFERMRLLLEWHEGMYASGKAASGVSKMRGGAPESVKNLAVLHGGQVCFDIVGNINDPALVPVSRNQMLYCAGWGIIQGVLLRANTPGYILLLAENSDEILYHGFITKRLERSDIAHMFANLDIETTWFAGFRQTFDIGAVENGIYRLALLTLSPAGAWLAASPVRIEVA